MHLGRIAVVGTEGLLGEIVTGELSQRAELAAYPDLDSLLTEQLSQINAIIVWASAWELGEIRQQLREMVPTSTNPVLMAIHHRDPYVYLCRLRSLHMERYRIGFAEMFDALAECIGRDKVLPAPCAPQNQLA